MKGIWKRLLVCMLVVLIFIPYLCITAIADSVPAVNQDSTAYKSATTDKISEYADYLAERNGLNTPYTSVAANMERTIISGNANVPVSVYIKQPGLYQVELTYRYKNNASGAGTLSLLQNGAFPFQEAKDIELEQLYENEAPMTTDSRGNDILPKQKVSERSVTYTLANKRDLNRTIYIELNSGENTMTFQFENTEMELQTIRFYNTRIPDYKEYSSKQSEAAESDYFQQIQAENAEYKNLSSLVPAADRSGPQTVPSDPVKKKLNILNATRWKDPGSSATWVITVPKDGYYHIGLRWRQNTMEGLFVSRRLLIDGEVPFSAMEAITFPYSDDWKYELIGGNDPYCFYLTAGKHELTLEAVSGDMLEVIDQLTNSIYELNTLYRQIIMVTGVSPDKYRDYNLFSSIKGLKDKLQGAAGKLNDVVDKIQELSGLKGGQTSIINQLIQQLKSFAADDVTIPDRLDQFKSNISAVASLMTALQEQPLDLDYITISGSASTQQPEGLDIGFIGKLAYQVQAFLGSFMNDYSAVGDANKSSRQIKVWYNGGREQAEIIKQLIDEKFSQSKNISVDLQLVQISLSQAIMAKTAPDVVLTTSRGQPVNLGIRGVLEDLSKLKDFNELQNEYTKKAFIPYTCRGAVYGIPINMNFNMMFVRTDVFDELGLDIPQTWDELYTIISKLQRANMTIGMPYSVTSSQSSIEAGMGSKDIFPALLFQNGGRIYNDELTATTLDEEATVEAFKKWVTLYTEYQLSTEYNFYNRFRTGEMPIGISDYSFYNTLQAATPEIRGLWTMVPIPGTMKNGVIDRSEATSGSACVILKDTKDLNASWDFVKWWCSADIQAEVGNQIELLMGEAARYTPANLNAIKKLSWTDEQLEVLNQQINWLDEIPEVIGGYYTARGLDNAFRNVLFNGENYREALMEQMEVINTELTRKQKEFPKAEG